MSDRRPKARAAAFMLVIAALVACSGGGKKTTAASSSGTDDINSTLPLTTRSTVATSSTTTSTTAPAACTAGPRPATAVRLSQASGDFDGDGSADTLVVYGTGSEATPAPYMVRIELGGEHGTVETPIVDAATDPNQNVKALGGSEVSARSGLPGDGSGAEAFVAVGSGASTFLVGIYQLTGCHLVRLGSGGGTVPVALPVGGTVTHLSGVRCDAGAGGARLVKASAESTDGATYQTTEQAFDIKGGDLVPAGPPVTGSLASDDPQLSRFSGLDCPGVEPI